MSKNDLGDRLIRFAASVMQLAEQLPNTKTGIQLRGKIIKFSSSSSLKYNEAQNVKSRKDFIRKLKVVLKELRATHDNLKIIDSLTIAPEPDLVFDLLKEVNELISIFFVSIQTATRNEAIAKRIKKAQKPALNS